MLTLIIMDTNFEEEDDDDYDINDDNDDDEDYSRNVDGCHTLIILMKLFDLVNNSWNA